MIGILFAILGFLFSLAGVAVFLSGILLFLMLPFISLVSNFKQFSGFFLKLAGFPIRRAAVVVSEHNDAIFRQMKFLGLGVETITIDDETKVFEDPDSALHYWNGMKFAIADEEHGVLFDPRHAAIGARKRMKEKRDEWEFLSTTSEWNNFNVKKWVPGVFEMPKEHELVDLSAVQELIDGGERSEFPERVEELYKHSQAPFASGASTVKYLYPVMGFAITFGGFWFMTSQFGTPNSSSVSFGTIAALIVGLTNPLPGLVERVKGIASRLKPSKPSKPDVPSAPSPGGGDGGGRDTASVPKKIVGAMIIIAAPFAVAAAILAFFGPVTGAAIIVVGLMGMATLPLLTLLCQPSKIISGFLSTLYFRLGFLGYRQPVFEWTPSKYRLREMDELDTTDDVWLYNLFGTTVGFTYAPGEESWGPEYMEADDVSDRSEIVTDGGSRDTNLPARFARTEHMNRDTYGGYTPKRPSDGSYYVHSGIAMNRFANSAVGEKSLRKLLEAKEKHGGGDDGMSDRVVFWATTVASLLGAIGGFVIFLLPTLI